MQQHASGNTAQCAGMHLEMSVHLGLETDRMRNAWLISQSLASLTKLVDPVADLNLLTRLPCSHASPHCRVLPICFDTGQMCQTPTQVRPHTCKLYCISKHV